MRPTRWVAVTVLLALCGSEGTAWTAVSSGKEKVSVRAGKTATVHLTVDPRPPVDIALVFDTTGSLGSTLATAKEQAAGIVSDIRHHVPDVRFAVAQFKDKGDRPEYRVEQKMTASADAVSGAVGRLRSSGGGDLPEAYNFVFEQSFTPEMGGPLGWRASSRKFVVVIGDAEPHGAGSAGIEGCEDTSADPHELNTATVLESLSAAGRTLVMVHVENHHAFMLKQQPASFECYQGLATAADGVAVEGHHDGLGHSIVHAVTDSVPPADPTGQLDLRVKWAPRRASPSWLVVSHEEHEEMDGAHHSGANFTVAVKPPRWAKPGTYRFELVALADGVDVGRVRLTVEVRKRKKGHQTEHH
ncbi:MAG TPA: vWA domain-containing protein [Acidimicrobiia bacterium]|nr:vWA domain-containing protein [Acidimicrobiia bacterium]